MSAPKPIDCAAALRLLADFLDGELPDHDRGLIERHIDTCRSCFSRAEFERQLKERLHSLGRSDVRPSFEQRIRSVVAAFAETESQREQQQRKPGDEPW